MLGRWLSAVPSSEYRCTSNPGINHCFALRTSAFAALQPLVLLPTELRWHSTARRKMGDPEGALADLDQALELDSDYAWALAERGELK